MTSPPYPISSSFHALKTWWREELAVSGMKLSLGKVANALWAVLCESLPESKRRRYGDIDYDWDYRVNTTSANVNWQTRLLGHLTSPYQPTEPALFHEMLTNLNIKFEDFTFIDIGSGKGRVLLMAADYPFHKVVGIELLPELHRAAEDNLRRYRSASQRCFSVEARCMNARDYKFPVDPLLVYLFNPLPPAALARMTSNLCGSLRENLRTVYVVYHNAEHERVFGECGIFRKTLATEQYSIFTNVNKSI